MDISKFGRKMAVQSGIGQLMDDLGEALASGRDVKMLGGGNPAHIPEVECHFRQSMTAMLQDGNRFDRAVGNYDPPCGNIAFINAMVELLRNQFGWKIGPKNVALTNGSQSAFFTLFNLFAGPYDDGRFKKVLFPLTPEYIGYCDVGLVPGAFVSRRPRIELIDKHLFKYHIDFEHLDIGDDIGAICVSRPTNPSGNVLTNEELSRLSDLAQNHNIPLIVDNAYGVPFPGIVFSDAEPLWNENTIVCMSLSKLGLPATRTGIVIASEAIADMVARVNAVMSLAPGTVGAAIATDLVRSGQVIKLSRETIRPFYENKAKRALSYVHKSLEGLNYHVHRPEGAFFMWLWLPDLPITNQQLYERLKARDVIVVPGHYFFPGLVEPWSHTAQCIRISYAQNDETVAQGIQVIAEEVKRAYGA